MSSLDWELDLTDFLDRAGLAVPTVVETDDGGRHHDGVVVQRWLDGRPPASPQDWLLVAEVLGRIHELTRGYTQRPGCVIVTELARAGVSLDADLAALPDQVAFEICSVFASFHDAPVSVVHGDPGVSNIRIDADGRVGLLDFDESRVDVSWHDLSNLGVKVLSGPVHVHAQLLSHAWEAVNGWNLEHDYAQRRLTALRTAQHP